MIFYCHKVHTALCMPLICFGHDPVGKKSEMRFFALKALTKFGILKLVCTIGFPNSGISGLKFLTLSRISGRHLPKDNF